MTLWAWQCKRAMRQFAVALVVGSIGVIGCGKSQPPQEQSSSANDPRAASNSSDGNGPSTAVTAQAANEDPLHQPFAKAVRQLDNPPAGCFVPPSGMTVSGKSVYGIYKDIVAQWEGIRFTTADGKPIHYSATLVTALGNIDLDLRPDLAPNHVRNFIALARAGYYDQLFVDRIYHDLDDPSRPLDTLEIGCPIGTGDDGYGSIGYWLLPETQPREKATHEIGTVGACRGMEKDSAACKFYITLSHVPDLDTHYTIFGKVTHGLDVAKRIFMQPVIMEDRGRFGLLTPEHPVMIQKVLIHTGGNGAEGQN
jgi:peptidyl-prolyl cis-trans isomerase B (cyclophilin B)